MQAKIISHPVIDGHFFAFGSTVQLLQAPKEGDGKTALYLADGADFEGGYIIRQSLQASDFEVIPE